MPIASQKRLEGRPRVIVVRTNEFKDQQFVIDKMDVLIQNLYDPIICTLPTIGFDVLENWAIKRKLTLQRFHLNQRKDWDEAYEREWKDIIAFALERKPAFCIAFMGSKDRELLRYVNKAERAGIKIRIIDYKRRKQ